MVCWAPYGFASQVRAAHVLFRCPPGRDGAGPWSGGLGAAGAGDPDRPRLGGGGLRWELWPFKLWRRSMQCYCGWSTWSCIWPLSCRLSRSTVELPGAGEQGRADTSPSSL